MELKKGEVKIFYEGDFNVDLDKTLDAVMRGFGYTRWASGMDTITNVRDLAYEKEGKE